MNDLPRVTYSNTGEDFSDVHAHLDKIIADAEARLLGKSRPAFVGGRDRNDGQVVAAVSPIDRDIILGEFPQADEALVDDAVKAARSAWPAWRDMGWTRRVAILRAGADVLEQRKWDVSVACLIEVGKSRVEALGELRKRSISSAIIATRWSARMGSARNGRARQPPRNAASFFGRTGCSE